MDPRLYDIGELMRRELQGLLSAEEKATLESLLREEVAYKELMDKYRHGDILHADLHRLSMVDTNAAFNKISDKIVEGRSIPVTHRVHFLKTAWVRYAAAAILVFGIGAYLWNTQTKEKPSVATTTNPVPVQNDALPGGNRATLRLANGTTIILNEAKNGIIAKQGNSIIDKTSDGQVIYRGTASGLPLEPAMNTMSTPRGGQYQLILPDGSRVWLNAESSITYPTAFSGNERRVSMTGEAYFEVQKDKSKPFIVSNGKETIEVIGTHFNVNAYTDEAVTKTSLLEGSVRIAGKLLKPGQAYADGKVFTTNTDEDVAWKNGLFYFNRTPVNEVLRQFSRWYDVDVVYSGTPPVIPVTGEMQRSLTLSQVLNILKGLELKFRIEERKLIVL